MCVLQLKNIVNSFLILILFVTVSCQSDTIDLPIENEKLVKILADMHVAEGLLQDETQAVKDSLSPKYYEQIFVKYGVKRADFDTTMSRLGVRPHMMEKIYEKVVEEFTKREGKG